MFCHPRQESDDPCFLLSADPEIWARRVDRGSIFLKRWMEHLEENADLRYPDV